MFRWALAVSLTFVLTTSCACAMTMRVVGDEVILSGPIVAEDIDQFATILSNNPSIKTVLFLNSPGGAAVANRAISGMIIERRARAGAVPAAAQGGGT